MGKGKRIRESKTTTDILYKKGYQDGVRDLQKQILLDARQKISWIGEKREDELMNVISSIVKELLIKNKENSL